MTIQVHGYCTVRTLPPLEFPHKLNAQRDLSDADLVEHLRGFRGYVQSKGGQMTKIRYAVIRHIQRVQHQLSLNIEDEDMDAFAQWATKANAICFLPDGTLRTPSGDVLVYPTNEEPNVEATLPYPEDAIVRKAATMKTLEQLGVRVPAGLPPVVGEIEVLLRPAQDVAKRALALFTVALRGESLSGEVDPIPVRQLRERLPLSFTALTPKEIHFLDSDAPKRQEAVNATWRYEALYLLQWAFNLTDELPLPTHVCDVTRAAKVMLHSDQASLVENAKLRPAAELLDALDLHFRLHWAARQARLDQCDPPAHLEPGVIVERHLALNWLVRFENAEWDEVDTPT